MPDPVRSRGVKRNARALIADKRIVLVHHDDLIGPDGTPFAELHAQRIPRRLPRGYRLLRGDREIEFAVVEHFGPEAQYIVWPICSINMPYSYGDTGTPVCVASIVATILFGVVAVC